MRRKTCLVFAMLLIIAVQLTCADNNKGAQASYTSYVPPDFISRSVPSTVKDGTQCYGLVDPSYPEFADVCGPLPQVRYSLPNALGHRQRWQISQALSTMLSTPASFGSHPKCHRSIRLLICPLLFPPCPTPNEPKPVIPCKALCQDIKYQCAVPSMDLLPCDVLPDTSDICPDDLRPRSSMLDILNGYELPEHMKVWAETALKLTQAQNPGSMMTSNVPYESYYPSSLQPAAPQTPLSPNDFFRTPFDLSRWLGRSMNGGQPQNRRNMDTPIFVNIPRLPSTMINNPPTGR